MAIASQLVDEYVAKIDIQDNASRPAEAVAGKLDLVSDAAENAAENARGLTRAMRDTGESAKIADPAFERLAQRVDGVTQAQRGLTRANEALQAAQAAAAREGAVDAEAKERQSRTIAELARRAETWARTLGEAHAEADALAASNDALNGTLGQGQAAWNQHIASVTAGAQASRASREAAELANQAERERAVQIQRLTSSLNGYVQANDPVAASLARVIRAEEELAQLRSLGINATVQQADTVARMRREHEELAGGVNRTTNALGLQRYQVQNVTAQFVDFGVQVSSGGGILLPLIQQAPQAIDAVGGVRSAVALLGQVFTPARIAAAGMTLAFGAMAVAANSQEGALATMQTRLRAVTADYLAMGVQAEAAARQTALAVPGLSLADARGAQVSLAAAMPRGAGFDLKALTAQAADFAAVMGIDAKAGVERFAQAMRDPVALVDDLAKQGFPGMNEALRLTVQRLVEGGQRADAFTLVIGRLGDQTKGAARDSLSPLGKAVDDLKKEFNAFFADIGNGLAGPAKSFADWLAASLRDLASVRQQQDAFDRRNEETARGGTDDMRVWGGIGAAGQIPFTPSASNPVNLPDVVRQAITVASARSGVDSDILARIYARGEQSRPNADGSWPVSPKGAEGPFQVMPATFAELAKRYNITGSANDPQAAATAAAFYFRENFQKYGDVGLAMGAYNAGPRRIDDVLAGKSELPNETAGYIRRTTSGYVGNPIVAGVVPAGAAVASDRVYGPAYPGADAQQRSAGSSSEVLDRALSMARGATAVPGQDGTLATQRAGLQQAIALAEQAKKLSGENAAAQDVLTAAQEKWRAALEAAKGPHAEFVEEQLRAVRAGEQLDPVQKAVTETLERYTDSMQRQGLTPSAGQLEEVRANKLRELQGAYTAATAEVDRQTESQRRIGAAYADGDQAVARATAAEKAHELVRTSGIASADARRVAEEGLTQALLDQQRVANDNAGMAANLRSKDNLALIERESQLVSMTAEGRERELAAMKARRDLESRPGGTSEGVIREAEQLARQTVDATAKTTQLKNSWAAIPGFVEETAGTIKNALVSAIAAGEEKAISFGNIWKAVKASAIGSLVELGAINPALNYVFGGTRGTLGGIGAVAAGGGAAGGATGSTGLMDGASGLAKLLGGKGGAVNTGFSWLDNSLNASAYSGFGGLDVSYGAALGGAAGIGGGLFGIYTGAQTGGAKGWAQGIGGAASTVAGISALTGAGAAATFGAGATAAATSAATAATIASTGGAAAIGGGAAAAGAGAGAAAAGGAGLGAAGGVLATVGAVAPYIAIAALIASYFLSGQKPSDMTGVYRGNLDTGVNDITGLTGDRYSQENRDTAANIGRSVADMATSLQKSMGVSRTPFAYEIAVGARDGLVASYGGKERAYTADETGSKALLSEITTALIDSMKGLASAEVQSIISASGGNADTTLANLDWYNGTYKTMIKASEEPPSAYQQQMDATLAPIDAAKEKARELGIAEDKLNEVRSKAIETLNKARVSEYESSIQGMYATSASLRGGNQLGAQLGAFDRQRTADWEGLVQQIRDLGFDQAQVDVAWTAFGEMKGLQRQSLIAQDAAARAANDNSLWDRFQAASGNGETLEGARWDYERRAQAEWTAAVADGMTDLTLLARTQTEERLKIEKDYAAKVQALDEQRRDSAMQTVTGTVTSLADYARGLRSGDASPLSLQSQYDMAQRDFQAVASAAQAGDWNSITKLQSYSDTLLAASRQVNGSGTGYVSDFGEVQRVLASIADLGADRLTASVLALETRTQTQVLVEELQRLRAEVTALRAETARAAATPAVAQKVAA